jgi:ubiquinone/menaquinone biosynthesis C-methylase UbiE
MIRRFVLSCARPIHRKLRERKLEIFFEVTGASQAAERLLDVGGGPGIDGEFLGLYSKFSETFIVNLQRSQFDVPSGMLVRTIIGDGRSLPFPSGSVDWVFSNAVIEHVGRWEDQLQFAAEVRRAARRGYFVTTPNKYFPIEPHTMFPYYQFLSEYYQRKVIRWWPGYMREYQEIHLLSKAQLQELFPEARIQSVPLPCGNTLVAYYAKA